MNWSQAFGGLLLLGAAGTAQAEWFTVSGDVGPDTADYIQVEPEGIKVAGEVRTVHLRVSRGTPYQSSGGILHRSFEARARINCSTRTARYLEVTFFAQPHFKGAPVAQEHFGEDDVRPMVFHNIAGDPTRRVIKAACSVQVGARDDQLGWRRTGPWARLGRLPAGAS